jgi:uncharacterized protein (DUF427 family)
VTSAIRVELGGITIVETSESWRVTETAIPPAYYLDPADFLPGVVRPSTGGSWCEWKGRASYADVVAGGKVARRAACLYLRPSAAYHALTGHLAI